MLFSSITFLYVFFPLSLISFLLTPKTYKNYTIVFFSLVFFYLGESQYFWLLIFAATVSFLYGKIRDKIKASLNNLLFVFTLLTLFSALFYFKYFDFLIISINKLFSTSIEVQNIALPLGISFYIFQASSYVIDVHRGDVAPEKSYINFLAYLSFFPQLIAGPIVRYEDVFEDVQKKEHSAQMMEDGAFRFAIGLSKKVLIANALGKIINEITSSSPELFWLSALAFTLQLYFDFSGYSDMAIGMGKLFGINFLENFNYPFMAESISDFWRRWHISLGIWFKSYVYIPLGGNRVKQSRLVFNLFIVWFLTGLWHGASFNFIVWGLIMWMLIVFEKLILKDKLYLPKFLRIIATFIVIVLSFVIFQNDDLHKGFFQIKTMLNFKSFTLTDPISRYMWRNNGQLIVISMILSTPLMTWFFNKIKKEKLKTFLKLIFIVCALLLSTASLVSESYNPFLYFRF